METKVLLSIKPEFANKIFEWTKKYEFRKTIFKEKGIKKVVVYASSPVQKVIWEFEIEVIIHKEKTSLWQETSNFSWISELFFNDYFSKKEKWYAIKIKKTKKYKKPLCLKSDFNINFPPQSFQYLPSF